MKVEDIKTLIKNHFESIGHKNFTCHLSLETPTVEYAIYKPCIDGNIAYLRTYLDIKMVMDAQNPSELIKISINDALQKFQKGISEYESQSET